MVLLCELLKMSRLVRNRGGCSGGYAEAVERTSHRGAPPKAAVVGPATYQNIWSLTCVAVWLQ